MCHKGSAVLNRMSSSRKDLVGMSRFFQNPKVNLSQMNQAMQEHCSNQIQQGGEYLVVHDTSDLNFSYLSGKLSIQDKEIGPTSHKSKKGVGFFVHPSLVIDPVSRFPLGYSNVLEWNRSFGQADRLERNYKKQPIEEKESYKWLESMQHSQWLLNKAKQITHVMDSDADMYDLFIEQRPANAHWIVRSCIDRTLYEGSDKLHAHLESLPGVVCTQLKIKGNEHRTARDTWLEVKFDQVKIARPASRSKKQAAYVELSVVQLREVAQFVPSGEKPVHWILLTTHQVKQLQQALQIVDYYTQRWIIEEVFSTLKTRGLCIESSQIESGIGLKKLSLMALQAALQIIQLVKDRSNTHQQQASLIFGRQARAFVQALIPTLEGKTGKQKNPYPAYCLAWAGWVVARLGGWKGYARESAPGPRTMKRGLEAFWHRYQGWLLATNAKPP